MSILDDVPRPSTDYTNLCVNNSSHLARTELNKCLIFFPLGFFTDETATIRVTNLSEDTRESDLQDLFKPFGPISRIYLAKDKITNQSKVSWSNSFPSTAD